ncbi:MAG: 2-C-methyl-D-erythritol 4-phosphate cytidylyltransferase [Clostridiales bacterium]|uniref:2-C-methyl-D-erythritol 4-phosphate cytidylyltransferase n=1 Tax=Terrisporobacter sp. TaxID=1965305 RepID=UPI002A46859E|nr:2-C-methyl-D-erythritol 4-phosphate cytidylyltransferase [Terrisporobacter sp.]MCI5628397.1 2-C-methyl-D-erythritol 4-phosphate cytidylyltransferase [Clostridium sp.]MDD5879015.1 2-C-methyl-D-erythritol 4-phosphate cytidylyltransferase [Clostridiales bacterium]MCI6458292.1 2-C-methyl-D-erythritol 4-phosphate cytidylyltransferase [Clostridium sp.]MCI7207719.1 2-C-methyl-D-erythritol 4-phosphate cytidylyltransferase [Clostridium sp.]MDD7753286.1 2-C-methyl-D-erythritol 4-phosphate cytidylyltr
MNSVVIVSAGRGSRMKADINKQFLKLQNKEVIAHTIDKFYNNENIGEIIVVVREDEAEFFKINIIEKYGYKNIKIAFGGSERQDSVYNGLKMVDENCKIVLIHDGARPFVNNETIDSAIESAKENKCVIVGVPVKDTIKVIDENNNVCDTPDRSTLWSIQTPQVFDYSLIMKAHEKAREDNYYGTDDSMLMEYFGQKVKVVEGSYNNIKITTPEDLKIGEEILRDK